MNIPHSLNTITPYFTVSDADRFMEFVVAVFGGTVVVKDRYPGEKIQHARILVGDSVIMLNESTEQYSENVSQMHIYVQDLEGVFSKALSVGAEAIMQPNIRSHGDYMAGIKDPFGNIWWIASKPVK